MTLHSARTFLMAGAVGIVVTMTLTSATASAGESEGVALAIVYDTSGSMSETVRDGSGNLSPKYVIANRALEKIARRIEAFATNTSAGGPRYIRAGLFVFQGSGVKPAVKFGAFDAAAFVDWARDFSTPAGGTPLGNALTAAGQVVLDSGLARKHVLIITDGNNTVGPPPAAVLPKLKQKAEARQTNLSVHFVAFDVDAKVFSGVKKLGATVLGAADESQLNRQLEFILEKKILLEDEEPPKK